MAIAIDAFLREWGFNANPFATTNAEDETEFLPAFFVHVPWFDQLVGNPQRPESLLLFAPQGYGKTSHRIELGRRAGQHETPALVVTLNDFSLLLHNGLQHVTIATYVTVLRQLFLEALDAQLCSSKARLRQLQADQRLWPLFCALLDRYAPRQAIGHTMPEGLQQHLSAIERVEIGAKAWLKELATIARAAGFTSVYVLLDGVDELYETKDNSQAIFRLISPLLDAPGLLQECGFAFKFFLPQDIEAGMRQNRVGRLDRIPSFQLTWTTEQLRDMLGKRLVTYSLRSPTNSNSALVKRFRDLCAVDFDVDQELARAANTSPRRMIDLAREIIVRHCASNSNAQVPINIDTVQAFLQPPATPLAPLQIQTLVVTEQPTTMPSPVTVPLLFIDARGDVWLGDRCLDAEMPSLMRTCLNYLWQHRNRLVNYAELQHALYGTSTIDREDPRGSCNRLVRRLRTYLEPGASSSHTYIDVRVGHGYVLCNFRDS